MKLPSVQNIANIGTIQDLARFVSGALNKTNQVLNGNVDLLDNGSNDHISFTFTNINTDVGVAHNLNRIPRGYTSTNSNNHLLSLQNGKTPWTTTTLYLQAGSTGTVTVLVF